VSHPGRHDSPTPPVSEPQILHFSMWFCIPHWPWSSSVTYTCYWHTYHTIDIILHRRKLVFLTFYSKLTTAKLFKNIQVVDLKKTGSFHQMRHYFKKMQK
jgi:hypothetical protein